MGFKLSNSGAPPNAPAMIAGIGGHDTGMAGHDPGIRENRLSGTGWSRSSEYALAMLCTMLVLFNSGQVVEWSYCRRLLLEGEKAPRQAAD